MDAHPRHYVQQVEANLHLWQHGNNVSSYAHRRLRPVEVVILARYRDVLSGRVLEVGCGAGRIIGYLLSLGGEVHGVDVSERMVAYCRQRFPDASVEVGDLRYLADVVDGRFDAVLLADNVLDVVDDATRRSFLQTAHELLSPAGLLIFSSHNLAAEERSTRSNPVEQALARPLGEVLATAARVPRRARNRRRMSALEYRAGDHAVLNDAERDFGALHYYIRHAAQQRQLEESDFELIECLDVDGERVPPGADSHDPWLHYIARQIEKSP